jgi:hypothetical protein
MVTMLTKTLDNGTRQVTIALRKFKVYADLSDETNCYTAEVLVDGKLAFTAENRGHGGCDFYHPVAPVPENRKVLADLEAFCKTLPREETYGLEMSTELVIGGMVEEELTARFAVKENKRINTNLRRTCNKTSIFRNPDDQPGEYRTWKYVWSVHKDKLKELTKVKCPNATFFNELLENDPHADAVKWLGL